ncbi:MAG: RNA polymerase factor sigma-70 [Gammaproteobacteria bacterium]
MTDTQDQTRNDTQGAPALLRDPAFLEELRLQMVKFATIQIGDPDLAEDAVQDALVLALRNAGSFGGRSALKTWVFAILKNRIIDLIRQRNRLVTASSLLRMDDEGDALPDVFDQKGFWKPEERPVTWGAPEAAVHDDHFWRVFEACLDNLPPKQARVFMMREFVELESGEICTALDISTSNLHVMLHRARLRLRECLENRWFAGGGVSC